MTLVTVAVGHWLAPGPAAAYRAMLADGCPAGITDAGRTNAEQWDMWRAYLAGKLTATAAYPGTSDHETGYALDLPAGPAAWVRAYGAAYGWIADRVKGEWWHFEYDPARATSTAGTTTEEDDMTRDELLEVLRSDEMRQRMKAAALEAIAQAGVPTATGVNPQALADAVAAELAQRLTN